MLRTNHAAYVMSTQTTSGETTDRKPDETVDAAYVKRFLEARDFFENLGGTEVHRRINGGGIHVVATSPDGLTVVETVFDPIRT